MIHEAGDALRRMIHIIAETLKAEAPPELLEEAERQVRSEFCGEHVYIASPARDEQRERRARIQADLAQGVPPKVVSERHGVSRRHLRRVRGRGV